MENLESQIDKFKKRLEEIEISTIEAQKLISNIDKKNEDILLKIFKKFQKYFDYYFKRIAPHGNTSMKLIRYNEGKKK